MAGFFEDIGEFFTGNKQRAAEAQQASTLAASQAQAEKDRQAAEKQKETAAQEYAAAQAQAEKDRAITQGGLQDIQAARTAMGATPEEYMAKSQAAASEGARQASVDSARQALMAARSAGLNRGQAAMRAGQQVGDTYNQALEAGKNQYGQAIQARAGLGQAQAGIGQQMQGLTQARQGMGIQREGMGTQASSNIYGMQYPMGLQQSNVQQQQAAQQGAAGGGGFAGLLSGISSLVTSDKNAKENIGKSGSLEELVAKVRPVNFNYKPGSGEDSTKERVGVLAQDLEKTSMADNVIDTPEGKKVDTGQQTLSNTNLIVQMAERLFELEAELKALRGGKK